MIDVIWLNIDEDHSVSLLRMDVGDAGGAGSKDGRREMSKKTIVTIHVR